jgi:hypothetical protein
MRGTVPLVEFRNRGKEHVQMKPIFTISALAFLFVVAPSPCFALWVTVSVSKEQAKELAMEVRSTPAGPNRPNQVRVELEFKTEGKFEKFSPEGKFSGYCGVELRIGEGRDPLVTAPLREDRSGPKPGRVVFSFTADRAQLEKLRLWVFAPESDGGTIYDLAVKDFVELK